MTLARSPLDGKLRWQINAEGGGRTGLVFNADPDGSNVTSPLGNVAGAGTETTGTTPPAKQPPATDPGATVTLPNGKTAAELAECIQKAQGDVEKLQACVQ